MMKNLLFHHIPTLETQILKIQLFILFNFKRKKGFKNFKERFWFIQSFRKLS